jgi:hypothetical protein
MVSELIFSVEGISVEDISVEGVSVEGVSVEELKVVREVAFIEFFSKW